MGEWEPPKRAVGAPAGWGRLHANPQTKPTSETPTPAMLRFGLRCVLTYGSTLRALLGQSLAWQKFRFPIWAWFDSPVFLGRGYLPVKVALAFSRKAFMPAF
jgi:hypothetical protein